MESAVQTTPPTRSTCSMPLLPARPREARATAVMMRVVRVMPLMGVTLIMATAHALTATNRKVMTSVSAVETSAR